MSGICSVRLANEVPINTPFVARPRMVQQKNRQRLFVRLRSFGGSAA